MAIDPDRRTGPSLSGATSRAIEAAVLRELSSVGFGRLTIDAVARRAGVGKAAVYRRFASKNEMVLAALARVGLEDDEPMDTGSLHDDVEALLRRWDGQLRHPDVARVVPDLLAETARDSTFGAAVYEHIGAPRRDRARPLLERAIARAELRPEVDLALCIDLLAAPLYWRLAVTREPFTEEDLRQLARVLVVAMQAA